MATKKKMLQAAAGNAAAYGGAGGLNIEDVFSTYLYEGNATQDRPIVNGINLADEGGMVWVKRRDNSSDHYVWDTDRGGNKNLNTSTTDPEYTNTAITSFNSDGFSLYDSGGFNGSGRDLASWTFRKAPKFFDVQTWTGTGSPRTISHNLGTTVGCMLVKRTSGTTNWRVYHRSNTSQPETEYLMLDMTGSTIDSNTVWNDTAPTDTEFTVGTSSTVNGNGETYVAYLFAHNDGDGDFGSTTDQDVIKCGSYTGNDGEQTIDLGFEPQWVMIKNATNTGNWAIFDVMRDFTNSTSVSGPDSKVLYPNLSNAETGVARIFPTANGFGFVAEAGGTVNATGQTYVYIAIRRPMAVPTDATDVFDINERLGGYPTPTLINTGNVVDLLIGKRAESSGGGETLFWDRLRGGAKYLYGDSTAAESGTTEYIEFDTNEGFREGFFNTSHNQVHWTWKRAPNFFDVVAYTGNGTAGRTVSHNLGVAPEMMWVKNRSGEDWFVYSKSIPTNEQLHLNTTAASTSYGGDGAFYNTAPTSEVFTLNGTGWSVNNSSTTYIAYLFASLDGVSKVGSYTGTGNTAQTIDCGFSSGARFVLIKRSSGASQWHVFDTERGITSTVNDGVLYLNRTNAEQPESSAFGASIDAIQPDSSGFKVQYSDINASGATFIFYAIA